MVDSLHKQLRKWKKGSHPKVVIIKGNGEKAFCSGGDIVSIYWSKVDKIKPEVTRNFFAQEYIVDNGLATMDSV